MRVHHRHTFARRVHQKNIALTSTAKPRAPHTPKRVHYARVCAHKEHTNTQDPNWRSAASALHLCVSDEVGRWRERARAADGLYDVFSMFILFGNSAYECLCNTVK